MAALAQVILSLGIGRSAAPAMKYMEPYGYITPTRLIGRHDPDKASNGTDLCNNPCYGSGVNPPEMLCATNERTRSYFGNYTFLTLVLDGEERVFDACVGPHMGKLSLAEYVDTAIEKGTENELYVQLKTPSPCTIGVIESGSALQVSRPEHLPSSS